MSRGKNNHLTSALNEVNGTEFVGSTVGCLMELSKQGAPQDEKELRERINSYFQFCIDNDFRPGIESLSLSLGITRQTFWNWCNNNDRRYKYSSEWSQICRQAKQLIVSFIESASLSGKLNPASSIFMLKNWGGYSDQLQIESISSVEEEHHYDFHSIDRYLVLPMFEGEEKSEKD
ncbi:hypothetical protein SAMN04487770_1636 [Butyrivibrio sp. ob235]|uniref:terminase small subunit n=1 Tax=Butyrivibrio sp. ob235 TaxID=1761780 RepID=UPI0008B05C28|nr:terminase small subunit [Butyrivibrio sp. ob235]SEM67547.1 hypothetical protein SAMN04487770_1636 [Butyrivibrio sp. ob235]